MTKSNDQKINLILEKLRWIQPDVFALAVNSLEMSSGIHFISVKEIAYITSDVKDKTMFNLKYKMANGDSFYSNHRLSEIQKQEILKKQKDKNYTPIVETSIVTARNAPAHKRAITTLQSFGIEVDKMFLLGGVKKELILKELKPHIFFDDQKTHLTNVIPSVHIPFFDSKNI